MQELRVDEVLVACLCAGWCRTCDAYRDTFIQVAREHPSLRFMWVDIEDEADALAPFDLDLDNFPTVMVARAGELRFLGMLTPHAATLQRTIDAAQSRVQPGSVVADGAALVAVLRRIGEPIG
jgi:thiol-disulfide isomerase/thioredoxin